MYALCIVSGYSMLFIGVMLKIVGINMEPDGLGLMQRLKY